jgi:ABC-type Fe3+/spermidine/putrescine transport system ATPase subunit
MSNENQVELQRVTLGYGSTQVVDAVDLDVEKGSFCTLLGPSGCGKTTLLRSIAGLVAPRSGNILIKGRRINDVPIHERNIGLVFQNYALFPHKNIFDNVAFGLKYRRVDRASMTRRVGRALDIVKLPHMELRFPSELSGGQQQRVALARAIVIEPDVLLLDEPLSALDANLREDMRVELKTIQRELGITTVFVTHDQEEALAISDLVVIMNRGRIEQFGTPERVYGYPCSLFVAQFLGRPNLLPAEVARSRQGYAELLLANGAVLSLPTSESLAAGSNIHLVIRADRLTVRLPDGTAHRNAFAGIVQSVSFLGASAAYVIESHGVTLRAVMPIDGRMLSRGTAVEVSVDAGDCALFGTDGMRVEVQSDHCPMPQAIG